MCHWSLLFQTIWSQESFPGPSLRQPWTAQSWWSFMHAHWVWHHWIQNQVIHTGFDSLLCVKDISHVWGFFQVHWKGILGLCHSLLNTLYSAWVLLFFRYDAGDHVAVYPINNQELVDKLGKRLNADLGQVFSLNNVDGELKSGPFVLIAFLERGLVSALYKLHFCWCYAIWQNDILAYFIDWIQLEINISNLLSAYSWKSLQRGAHLSRLLVELLPCLVQVNDSTWPEWSCRHNYLCLYLKYTYWLCINKKNDWLFLDISYFKCQCLLACRGNSWQTSFWTCLRWTNDYCVYISLRRIRELSLIQEMIWYDLNSQISK